MAKSHYDRLGVDAGKQKVRRIFKGAVDNDFPGAWVNIIRHPRRRGWVLTLHLDGDGSKLVQRVLGYRETADADIFRGAVDDALSSNTGDIACSGFVSGVVMVGDILDVSRFSFPKNVVMRVIKERFVELRELYRRFGIQLYFMGGETADLPHQVMTGVFNAGVSAEAREKDLILGNVQPGDFISGFASGGWASFEDEPNSAIMTNGLTLGRMCTMARGYTKKYPDLVRRGGTYEGRYKPGDKVQGLDNMTIGQALLSPMRQWAIVIKILVDKLKKRKLFSHLHGITMYTGGGATKDKHLGQGGILYEKVMPEPPQIFQVIQRESKEPWIKMYEDFNCGIGLGVIGTAKILPVLEEVSAETNIQLYRLGSCVATTGRNKVALWTPYGKFRY